MSRSPLKQAALRSVALVALAFGPACDCGGTTDNNQPDMVSMCVEGAAACPCKQDQTCNAGLVCQEGMCAGAASKGLVISSADARACDVLLTEGTGEVLGATFVSGVTGVHKRRAPNVAVSFARDSDAAFDPGSVTLTIAGEETGFTIKSSTCYDASGTAIAGATVSAQ